MWVVALLILATGFLLGLGVGSQTPGDSSHADYWTEYSERVDRCVESGGSPTYNGFCVDITTTTEGGAA